MKPRPWWIGKPAAILIGALLVQVLSAGDRPAEVSSIDLHIGEQRLTAEVVDTEPLRRQGLMFRESLPENHGMLFVWSEPARYAMWMQNTPLPLSVAFIDADGRIVNIEHMKPHTTRVHRARTPVIYALEMEQGWFESRGIRPGDRVTGLPD
jgi:uncharacterized protein